jgi:glycerophosphoryl diester phosphodiesterase
MHIVAHRGSPKDHVENTIAAFDHAVSCGVDRIELDVRVTGDGVPVIFHDESLQRLAGDARALVDCDWETLKLVSLSDGSRLLSLECVLERYLTQVELNLEFKSTSIEFLTCCGESIRTARENISSTGQNPPRVIASCFDLGALLSFRQLFSEVDCALLGGEGDNGNLLSAISKHGLKVVHPHANAVDESFMAECRRLSCSVVPWVPLDGVEDDPHDRVRLWQKMCGLGVSGLCTNYPCEFKRWSQQYALD